MNDQDALDFVFAVSGESRFDLRRSSTMAPVTWDVSDLEGELLSDLAPEIRKMPRFKEQHFIPGEKEFTSAASQAPVPDAGYKMTGCLV